MVRRLSVDLRWVAIVGFAAAVALCLMMMLDMPNVDVYYFFFGFVATILLVVFLAWPDFVVPALLVTIPLEISKLWFPFLLVEKGIDGRDQSIIEISRIVLVIAIAASVLAVGTRRNFSRVRSELAVASMLFLVYSCTQGLLLSPSSTRAMLEAVRLAMYIILLIVTVQCVSTMPAVDLAIRTLMLTGGAIAALGLYQAASGHYFWLLGLAAQGRINVTFGDPNILGRYLAIVVISGLVLMDTDLISKTVLWTIVLASSVSLILTGSRSAWLVTLAGMCIVWWFTRHERGAIGRRAIALGAIGCLIMVSDQLMKARAETVWEGTGALGPRLGLIATGIQMYVDHPIFGVGFGGYNEVALRYYMDLLPYRGLFGAGNLSHTSLVTIAAELGTVGLALTFWIFKAAVGQFKYALGETEKRRRTYAVLCFAGVVVIVLSAQAAARMFEEPMLWVLLGILSAMARMGYEQKKLSQDQDATLPGRL